MLSVEAINTLIGVEESFQASYKLLNILKSEGERDKLFNAFLELENDLSYDWFTEYYQEEHSNRKDNKQDFTPDGIATITSELLNKTNSNSDIAAGTGGLTIKIWANNPDATFHCEEYSERAVPFLLFNLAIRNVNATVLNGDSLSREFKHMYKLNKGERFSSIEEISNIEGIKSQTVIMNPPYSMKWEPKDDWIKQERFSAFEKLAPKSKSDYAFLLEGLSQLDQHGNMAIVLPSGVLFRGGAEGVIRKNIIEMNLLDAVIGMPGNVFYNTQIPTVILIIKKNRADKDTLFIDASKEYTKKGKYNEIEEKHIHKIIQAYKTRKDIEKFSFVASLKLIKENEYNLNIPRYVDTYEEQPVESLKDLTKELKELDAEINKTTKKFATMLQDLRGKTQEHDDELIIMQEYFREKAKLPKQENDGKGEQLKFL